MGNGFRPSAMELLTQITAGQLGMCRPSTKLHSAVFTDSSGRWIGLAERGPGGEYTIEMRAPGGRHAVEVMEWPSGLKEAKATVWRFMGWKS